LATARRAAVKVAEAILSPFNAGRHGTEFAATATDHATTTG
jgi:hypothetical protein